ncbi:MsnO8 family LLM class oxidoreductase [uncultured Anaerococcus sp.]|uniref:MsnO8 family LLM class oxidoreductase n=1 Tax=uncultured Anaerococcus sp. TaxID=293428 RepID=UPI002602E862|nr:MsnO8 family LLM class oxidoreductase [uncultured Anaerococcus sp.]
MKLGVHDLMLKDKGTSNKEHFDNTKKLVESLDEIGYDRYWFAEHHGFDNLLSVAPEILVSYFLAKTKNMNIGTGGSMIMHYSPLKIAETFKTLTELEPGRVDLGIGRAPGCGISEKRALNNKFSEKTIDLYDEIQTIMDYLLDNNPTNPIYTNTKAVPTHNEVLVNPWILGSTGKTAAKAAEWGLPYSFAKFFLYETSADVFKDYKKDFKSSVFLDKPYISISYKILISDDKEELEYLGKSFDYYHIQQTKSDFRGIVNPEELKDYHFNLNEQAILKKAYDMRYLIKGSKEEVSRILEDEIEKYYIDEILSFSPIFGIENRIKSYKLLKEIFD